MSTLGRYFQKQVQAVEISAICGVHDLLVIGFTNGVLVLLDVEKLDIVFTHKVIIQYTLFILALY